MTRLPRRPLATALAGLAAAAVLGVPTAASAAPAPPAWPSRRPAPRTPAVRPHPVRCGASPRSSRARPGRRHPADACRVPASRRCRPATDRPTSRPRTGWAGSGTGASAGRSRSSTRTTTRRPRPTSPSTAAPYGLPPCTTANGCFRKVNQRGAADPAAARRRRLGRGDRAGPRQAVVGGLPALQASCWSRATTPPWRASATGGGHRGPARRDGACPTATAARRVRRHARAASVTTTTPASPITVASGDFGFTAAQFPAVFTTRHRGRRHHADPAPPAARGWAETAWWGAGSGCSAWIAKPRWQKDPNCQMRTIADVSAVADPDTGAGRVRHVRAGRRQRLDGGRRHQRVGTVRRRRDRARPGPEPVRHRRSAFLQPARHAAGRRRRVATASAARRLPVHRPCRGTTARPGWAPRRGSPRCPDPLTGPGASPAGRPGRRAGRGRPAAPRGSGPGSRW